MVATTREAQLTEIYESLDLDLELSLDVPGRNLDEIWTKWRQVVRWIFCPEEGAEGTEGNDESQGRRLDFAKDFSEEALSRRCQSLSMIANC